MSNSLKEVPQIKELMVKGRNVGYLMAEEIGKSLPPELATSENMEELIGIFEFMEIAIVDSEKEGQALKKNRSDQDSEPSDTVFDDTLDSSLDDDIDLNTDFTLNDDSTDFAARNTDPVRMYLREMGAVPLLDRDGEVVIAKKIENISISYCRSCRYLKISLPCGYLKSMTVFRLSSRPYYLRNHVFYF